jgi:hypothetical protein
MLTTEVVIAVLIFLIASLNLVQTARVSGGLRAIDIAGTIFIVSIGIVFLIGPQRVPRGVLPAGWVMVGVFAAWRIAIEVRIRRRRSDMKRNENTLP